MIFTPGRKTAPSLLKTARPIAWQSWLQARSAMSFGDVTSDLSLPKILYWAPLVFGIAAGAVAAAAMAVKRGARK